MWKNLLSLIGCIGLVNSYGQILLQNIKASGTNNQVLIDNSDDMKNADEITNQL